MTNQLMGWRDGKSLSCIPELIQNLSKYKEGRIAITFKKGPKRTLQQNNYYRLLLGIIGNDIGYSSDEMHDIFKSMFLKEEEYNEKIGQFITIIKDSKSLTVDEFREYVEKVRMRSDMQGIITPDAQTDTIHNTTQLSTRQKLKNDI